MKKTTIKLLVIIITMVLPSQATCYENVDIHGFIAQGFLQSTENNFLAETKEGTFQFNEMGINFSTDLGPKLRVGIQFFARDLGEIGNDEITLDWGYADYRWKKWLGLRVGKIKSPFGLYNESRDVDMLRTSIFLPQSVYSEPDRASVLASKGVGVYGKLDLHFLGNLYYRGQVGVAEASKDSGSAKTFEDRGFEVTEDFDMDLGYIAALDWQTPIGLRLLASGRKTGLHIYADSSIGSVDYHITDIGAYFLSMEFTWEDLIISAEYFTMRSQYLFSASLLPSTIDGGLNTIGYYGGASYRFLDWFQMGFYYSEFFRNKDDKSGDENVVSGIEQSKAWSKDFALSLRFDINEYWIVKLEGHLIDGTGIMYNADNINNQGEADYEEDWMLFAAKVSFNF